MTGTTSLFGRILDLGRLVCSAGRAASAVESGHAPRPSDLRRLGIDARTFGRIGRG